MDYELAKKLKKAGFKQYGVGQLMNGSNMGGAQYAYGWKHPDETLYYPTLSELIEACRDGFESLHHVIGLDHVTGKQYRKWRAQPLSLEFIDGRGKTPEEAVAKLYLALNE